MNDAVYVEITATRGSTPRDPGTAMKVTATGITGTIGGGALEHQAVLTARKMLAADLAARTETVPLGPSLGQCCGGTVTLHFSYAARPTDIESVFAADPLTPVSPQDLWLWGAGHVGRAVVRNCPPGAFDITWVDAAADRFPDTVPDTITTLPTTDMPRLAQSAPFGALHLIFTYSHEIDLALCATLLDRQAASIGLIGSATKWARFAKRLRAAGLDPAPITCPIGDKSLGKSPDAIAKGCVNRLLDRADCKET